MSIQNKFERYEAGDWPIGNDMNLVRSRLEMILSSLAINGIIASDGLTIRSRRGTSQSMALRRATILSTLERGTPENSFTEKDYYTIQLIGEEPSDWDPLANGYSEGDKVTYIQKIYTCIQDIPANLVSSIPPTTTSHWEEFTGYKTGVLGYYETLLGTTPWFQVGSVHYVINYEDSKDTHDPKWTWWLLRTVTKIEEGTGANKIASLYWHQEDEDDHIIGRLCSVYR